MLLLDAIRRVVKASASIAMSAIIVDAKSELAQGFYERYGFRAFISARRLFLPLETCAKLALEQTAVVRMCSWGAEQSNPVIQLLA